MSLTIVGMHDEKTIAQAQRCVDQEEGSIGFLAADGHFGYSAPVGMNIAYREHISPAAVGYDIGCGNMACKTDLTLGDLAPGDVSIFMDRIFAEVAFGVGRRDGRAADHAVIDRIREADFEPQRKLVKDAAAQLGTVGAGNHYVDLFADEWGVIWIGVHFGSRGFGHKTASGFLAMAKGLKFEDRVGEGEMEAPPDLIRTDSDLGQSYIQAMRLAGQYAHAGREVVVDQVLTILGAESRYEVHNHHNFAWLEEHENDLFWVIRKGATPAFPGQKGFVGATMGEPSVILEGVESAKSESYLYSTVHGAGRAMSRTAAAGKSRKRWSCLNRDCDWVQKPFTHKPEDGNCPTCGNTRLQKRWVQETEGRINWNATLEDLATKNIELRGANAEEAPGAYKRLRDVLAYHEGTVRVLHTLYPLGVAMAPSDTRDPYKD